MTYATSCFAYVEGVMNTTPGICEAEPDVCVNTAHINPERYCSPDLIDVCGCDGVTYADACTALFEHGVTHYTPGSCELQGCYDHETAQQDIACSYPTDEPAVCGCNGVTYQTSCHGLSQGIVSTTEGPCEVAPEECVDPLIAPTDGTPCNPDQIDVCGCDGTTYTDGCTASFDHGITHSRGRTSWTEGACGVAPAVCVDMSLIGTDATPCNPAQEDVCGCDGVTYSDACTATFEHGVTHWTPGACP